MDFINIAKQLCSVRSYMDKKVEADKLEKILEANLPSNLKPVNILVIGYSDEGAADINRFDSARIPMSQLVSYESL